MAPTAQEQFQTLQTAIAQFTAGGLSANALGTLARNQPTLLQTLPPRYGQVLLDVLDRLESSALFSEESCSFSQKDLLANLQLWRDKAQQQLNAQAPE